MAMITYDVVVTNIGNVKSGVSQSEALEAFKHYVAQSKSNIGRAGGESVAVFDCRNGELYKVHYGPNAQ